MSKMGGAYLQVSIVTWGGTFWLLGGAFDLRDLPFVIFLLPFLLPWPALFFPMFLAVLRGLHARTVCAPVRLAVAMAISGLPLGLLLPAGMYLAGGAGNVRQCAGLCAGFFGATVVSAAALGWFHGRHGARSQSLPVLTPTMGGLVGAAAGWVLGFWGMLLVSKLLGWWGNLSGLAEVMYGVHAAALGGGIGVGWTHWRARASQPPAVSPTRTPGALTQAQDEED